MQEENIDSDFSNTPPELQNIATTVTLELLPQKSRFLYEKQFSWNGVKKIRPGI